MGRTVLLLGAHAAPGTAAGCRGSGGSQHPSYAFINGQSLSECAALCSSDDQCSGMEYFIATRKCQLQNFEIYGSSNSQGSGNEVCMAKDDSSSDPGNSSPGPACSSPLDLAFLLDGSGSIEADGQNGYFNTKVVKFVADVVAGFDVGQSLEQTRVGVATFAGCLPAVHGDVCTEANWPGFSYRNNLMLDQASQDIGSFLASGLDYWGGKTFTGAALEKIRTEVLKDHHNTVHFPSRIVSHARDFHAARQSKVRVKWSTAA